MLSTNCILLYWAGTKHFNEINIPIYFGIFFEYQGTQFLDNVICHSYEIFKWMLFLTDPAGDPDQFASNADSSYISGKRQKCDLPLKWRNCLTLHLMIAFTSHVYLALDTKQSDQQTNLLLILLRGKIHMIMI